MEEQWQPPLFPKQNELLSACLPSRKNMVLTSGPRKAGKTIAAVHAIANHALITDKGNICVVTISQTAGFDSGVWPDLVETVLPQWIEADIGMRWVREPFIEGVSKKPKCIVSNIHGNQTTIQLDSLKVEKDAETRFKGKRYSMIFVNELSNFKLFKTFITWKQCLRTLHLKPEEHLFLADTNPPDEGKNAWFYKLWFDFSIANDLSENDKGRVDRWKDQLNLVKFQIRDNLSLTDEDIKDLEADFGFEPDLYKRYFLGEYVTSSTGAIFADVFRPNFHLIGDEIEEEGSEVMVPQPDCFQLITSHDPGSTNYAAVIIEKTIIRRGEREVPIFKVLDEQVEIGSDFYIEDFAEQLVKKMEHWEKEAGKPGKILWSHWSDRMAFDTRIPFSERFWFQHIADATAGRIVLMATQRGRGHVKLRVELLRRLLFEERIFFFRPRCPHIIEMLKSIKAGKNANESVERGSPFKHVFDALTYGLTAECEDELSRSVAVNFKRKDEVGLIQVAL